MGNKTNFQFESSLFMLKSRSHYKAIIGNYSFSRMTIGYSFKISFNKFDKKQPETKILHPYLRSYHNQIIKCFFYKVALSQLLQCFRRNGFINVNIPVKMTFGEVVENQIFPAL